MSQQRPDSTGSVTNDLRVKYRYKDRTKVVKIPLSMFNFEALSSSVHKEFKSNNIYFHLDGDFIMVEDDKDAMIALECIVNIPNGMFSFFIGTSISDAITIRNNWLISNSLPPTTTPVSSAAPTVPPTVSPVPQPDRSTDIDKILRAVENLAIACGVQGSSNVGYGLASIERQPPESLSLYYKHCNKESHQSTLPLQYASATFDKTGGEENMNYQMTSYLKEASEVPDDFVFFFNSETSVWLASEEFKLRPDGFVCCIAFVKEEAVKRPVDAPKEFLYGRCREKYISQVLLVWEGKVEALGDEHKGKMCKYLYWLGQRVLDKCRGILYNDHSLIHMEKNVPGQVVYEQSESKWPKDVGVTRQLIVGSGYEYPPLTYALLSLLKQFQLSVSFNAVLGQGASGHVFKVKSTDQIDLALKVVVGSRASSLKIEYTDIRKVYSTVPHLVVQVLQFHESLSSSIELAGYVLAEVCEPLTAQILSKNRDYCISIFKAVVELHQNNLLHGDLRLPNILLCSDKRVKFIDFASGGGDSEERRKKDVGSLLTSILGNKEAVVRELVGSYRCTQDCVSKLANAVFGLLSGRAMV